MTAFIDNLAVLITAVVGLATLIRYVAASGTKTTAAITRLDITIGQLEKTLERIQTDHHNDQLDVLRRLGAAETRLERCTTKIKLLEARHDPDPDRHPC